ncbi:hypothetical protein OH77DRAFT_1030205 [Trametes cingulata]|nr:hypothetical protein OH77DRAFT_1030205 [Trametes cingulata]
MLHPRPRRHPHPRIYICISRIHDFACASASGLCSSAYLSVTHHATPTSRHVSVHRLLRSHRHPASPISPSPRSPSPICPVLARSFHDLVVCRFFVCCREHRTPTLASISPSIPTALPPCHPTPICPPASSIISAVATDVGPSLRSSACERTDGARPTW